MPARTAYHDELGDHFARHADTSPYNVYTDRPAILPIANSSAEPVPAPAPVPAS